MGTLKQLFKVPPKWKLTQAWNQTLLFHSKLSLHFQVLWFASVFHSLTVIKEKRVSLLDYAISFSALHYFIFHCYAIMEDLVVLTLMKSTAVVIGRIISHCLSLQHCFFLCVFSSSAFISFKWKPFSPRHCSQVVHSWWPCSHPVQFSFEDVTISGFFLIPKLHLNFTHITYHTQWKAIISTGGHKTTATILQYMLGTEPPASFFL